MVNSQWARAARNARRAGPLKDFGWSAKARRRRAAYSAQSRVSRESRQSRRVCPWLPKVYDVAGAHDDCGAPLWPVLHLRWDHVQGAIAPDAQGVTLYDGATG